MNFRTALIVFLALVPGLRAETELAEYTVARSDGAHEIRDYPELAVATVTMGEGEMDDSFMKLFRFIDGKNEASAKIAMTAPVLIQSGEKQRSMSFVMPKKTVAEGVPKPSAEGVKLETLKAARFAALRFKGTRSPENEAKASAALKVWLEAQKLKPTGEPLFAYYDPPWIPVFMRRNEVLYRIEKPKEAK